MIVAMKLLDNIRTTLSRPDVKEQKYAKFRADRVHVQIKHI